MEERLMSSNKMKALATRSKNTIFQPRTGLVSFKQRLASIYYFLSNDTTKKMTQES